jgi:transcriptional regulator with XRE-family HTH domain
MAAQLKAAQIAATNHPLVRSVLTEVARQRREDAELFGARLRELRDRSGLTQQKAAEKIGVSYRTWQSWEQGTSTPRWPNKKKIARLFGITVDELNGAPYALGASEQQDLGEIREQLRQINAALVTLNANVLVVATKRDIARVRRQLGGDSQSQAA